MRPERVGPGGRFWRLCLIGSLGLHAVLLLGLGRAPHPSGSGLRGARPASLTVRQLLVADRLPEAPQAPAPDTQAATVPSAGPAVLPDPPAQAALPAQPPVVGAAASPDATGDEPGYLPRRELDDPPKLLLHVNLLWPDDGPPAGHYKEVLSLFIDEAGVVQRVRVDGPGLPDSLRAVARNAFLQAHFSPGRVKGFEVKSWIRMEVEFDADARNDGR